MTPRPLPRRSPACYVIPRGAEPSDAPIVGEWLQNSRRNGCFLLIRGFFSPAGHPEGEHSGEWAALFSYIALLARTARRPRPPRSRHLPEWGCPLLVCCKAKIFCWRFIPNGKLASRRSGNFPMAILSARAAR